MTSEGAFVFIVEDSQGRKIIYGDKCRDERVCFLRASILLNVVPMRECIDCGPLDVWPKSWEIDAKYWPAKELGTSSLESAQRKWAKIRRPDRTNEKDDSFKPTDASWHEYIAIIDDGLIFSVGKY